MEITEVRIKLMDKPEDRLRGFCSVTFDACFVIRDLKIIEGNKGPFVAMPSRKLTSNCHKCRGKNNLRSNYCNHCGVKLKAARVDHDTNGRAKLYADIAHPINAECREAIQSKIIEALLKEEQLADEPGYRSRYDESYDDRNRSHTKKTDSEQRSNDAKHDREVGNAKEDSAPSKSSADADSENEGLSTKDVMPPPVELPKSDNLPQTVDQSQAEVETRIDIPRPTGHEFGGQSNTLNRRSHSDDSDLPKSAVSPADAADKDDIFGDGIF